MHPQVDEARPLMDDWSEELLAALTGGDATICAFAFCDYPSRQFSEGESIFAAEYSGLTFWFHPHCHRRQHIFYLVRLRRLWN